VINVIVVSERGEVLASSVRDFFGNELMEFICACYMVPPNCLNMHKVFNSHHSFAYGDG
jgi:hypothetical protein